MKYRLETMPKHLYDKTKDHLSDMVLWPDAYRTCEISESENAIRAQAPPSNEKPKTPTNGKRTPKEQPDHTHVHWRKLHFLRNKNPILF